MATACSASISAPVRATVRTVASIAKPPRRGSTATSTCVRGRGWHIGMASAVRLAAMTPARRATSATPPLRSFPDRASRMAAAEITMRPRATASRAVTGLAETSTIRAAPCASRWDSVGWRGVGPDLRGAVALQEAAQQQCGRPLPRLGPHARGLEDDEGVGARVGHDVRRAHGGQGPRHEPPALEAYPGGKVGLAPRLVAHRLQQLDLDRGPREDVRTLHAQQRGAH